MVGMDTDGELTGLSGSWDSRGQPCLGWQVIGTGGYKIPGAILLWPGCLATIQAW